MRYLRVTFVCACVLLAFPYAAQGATLTVNDAPKTFTYEAGAGEVNDVQVTQDGTTVQVADSGASITLVQHAANHCTATDASHVSCTLPAFYNVKVDVADGDDRVTFSGSWPVKLDGGPGSDVLEGGSGADKLDGDDELEAASDGNDILRGGPGIDELGGSGGDDRLETRDDAADEAACGTGNDHVTADTLDTAALDCEQVDNGLVGPGDGGAGSGGPDGGAGEQPAPVMGESVTASTTGTVTVKAPGSDSFTEISVDSIPVGSVIDATDGKVTLISAVNADGTTQSGTFWGGAFVVRQKPGSALVTLRLAGGDFSSCRSAGDAGVARSGFRRRLWGRDRGGRFRTRGRRSQATIRGTRWLTVDRCDGTLTRVTEGAVKVRDFGRKKSVLVRAGERYLARG